MTNTPLSLLYVYGSLVSRIAHPMGERLRAEARLVGPATVQGRLYRVSWYPGVVLSEDAADRVHGEIYRLSNPAATLAWLDEYEAITPGTLGVAADDEYERQTVTVTRPDGSGHTAWMYVYRRDPTGVTRVASGVWTGAAVPG